jgi:hypothetical protein
MSQPERPIEQQLHAVAQERRRRSGGPFELHPATRRLLQGEVARQYGAGKSTPTLWLRWVQLSPRLVWSLGTFLVLGVAAWVTWQSSQPARLVQSSAADRSQATNQLAGEASVVATASRLEKPDASAGSASPVAPAPMGSATRGVEADALKSKAAETPALLADATRERAIAVASPSSLPRPNSGAFKQESTALAAAAPTVASALGGISNSPEAAADSQAFPFSNRVATPATNALATFTVEQNGADLKVVDADGSIYTGRVMPAGMELAPEGGPPQPRKDAAVAGARAYGLSVQPPAQSQIANQNSLNFRVVGTNRSLNQNVVFTGSFVPAEEASNAQVITNAKMLQNNRVANQGTLRNQQQSQQQVPWNNGRISGQAVLGNKQTIAVEASPSQK